MQDLVNIVNQIRVLSAESQIALSKKYSMQPGDPPFGAFAMCNQQSIIALELLSYYLNVWSKVSSSSLPDPDQTRQENAERVVTLTKAMFVFSVSGMEFDAKNAIKAFPTKIPPISGRIYLRRIISQSAKAKLITSTDEEMWEGAIETRNIIVHNNGISEVTKEYSYPNGLKISLNAGKMTRGNLKFFAELTHWTVQAYSNWCQAFLG